jgi:hypothetical protein
VVPTLVVFFVGVRPSGMRHDAGRALEPNSARGDVGLGTDQDLDGLPDAVERLLGTDPLNADTDGDGCGDLAEWALHSDPRDPNSQPRVHSAVRSCAYEENGRIHVFCAVYPSNLALIDSFHLIAGSTAFTDAPDGDPGTGVGLVDLSSALGAMIHDVTTKNFLGYELTTFDFEIERSMLASLGSINVAFTGKLADETVAQQLYLGLQGSTSYVVENTPAAARGDADPAIAEPLQPTPPVDEDPEYCALGMSDGTPVGLASVQYTVTSASCAPDGLLYCIAADCQALAGQTFTLVDYGYLQGQADQ